MNPQETPTDQNQPSQPAVGGLQSPNPQVPPQQPTPPLPPQQPPSSPMQLPQPPAQTPQPPFAPQQNPMPQQPTVPAQNTVPPGNQMPSQPGPVASAPADIPAYRKYWIFAVIFLVVPFGWIFGIYVLLSGDVYRTTNSQQQPISSTEKYATIAVALLIMVAYTAIAFNR